MIYIISYPSTIFTLTIESIRDSRGRANIHKAVEHVRSIVGPDAIIKFNGFVFDKGGNNER